MQSRRRRWWVALIVASGFVAGGGAGVWACVALPVVTVEPQGSGLPGTKVTVHGTDFGGDIDIRWNKIDGPRLATATADGGPFSAEVTIPEAPAGLYSIVVVARRPDGSLTDTKGVTLFQVIGTGPVAEPAAQRARLAPGEARGSGGLAPAAAAAAGAGLLILGCGIGVGAGRRRPRVPVAG